MKEQAAGTTWKEVKLTAPLSYVFHPPWCQVCVREGVVKPASEKGRGGWKVCSRSCCSLSFLSYFNLIGDLVVILLF